MNEERTIEIAFPDQGVFTRIKVSQEGPFMYRLLQAPILTEGVSIFDTVELEDCSDGTYRFVRIMKRSGWRTSRTLLTEKQSRSDRLETLFKRVIDLGGYCDLELGGLLIISIPPGSDFDPAKDIVRLE